MRVLPNRNKPFVCDECGEEISTDKDYRKIVFIRHQNGEKYRNKFCGPQCFEKWNLVHTKESMPQESLEEGIELEVYDRDDEREEEEEHYISEMIEEPKEAPKAEAYVPEAKAPDYYTQHETDEAANHLEHFDPKKAVSEDIRNVDTVNYGYVYEKGFTGKKEIRTRALTTWEKFRDKLKMFKIIYDRDDWG